MNRAQEKTIINIK